MQRYKKRWAFHIDNPLGNSFLPPLHADRIFFTAFARIHYLAVKPVFRYLRDTIYPTVSITGNRNLIHYYPTATALPSFIITMMSTFLFLHRTKLLILLTPIGQATSHTNGQSPDFVYVLLEHRLYTVLGSNLPSPRALRKQNSSPPLKLENLLSTYVPS